MSRWWLAALAALTTEALGAGEVRIVGAPTAGAVLVGSAGDGPRMVPLAGLSPVDCGRTPGFSRWAETTLVGRPWRDAQVEEVRALLVRAGWAVSGDAALAGYMDEAIAEGAGAWACASALYPFESSARRRAVPATILYAVAMNESERAGRPWPWTLNVAGRGFYFRTREDAWRAANWLLANGQRNFDVGAMQVSWKHNGARFGSTWEALQPGVNVDVGAAILRENFEASGDWATAVRWYHNRTDVVRGSAYLARFMRHFRRALHRDEPRGDRY